MSASSPDTAPASSSLAAVETDRWRITPQPDDTYVLQVLAHDGPSNLPADTLLLTAADIPELANLFAIATDMLSGSPACDVSPRLNFVFPLGTSENTEPFFSAYGQPPPVNSIVTLPVPDPDGGRRARRLRVHETSWEYKEHGAACVTLRMVEAP